MVHTIFSSSDNSYQAWQSRALYRSWRQVKQPGSFTRLLSASQLDILSWEIPTFLSKPCNPYKGDDYSPRNKPKAILDWCRASGPKHDTVLILDPDCFFTSTQIFLQPPGRARGHHYSYMDPGAFASILARHKRKPERFQPVGIPLFLNSSDLLRLAELWLKYTEEVRANLQSRKESGWVAEMIGYCFAVDDLGIQHDRGPLCCFPNDSEIRPIIHYCYSAQYGKFKWDKRDHKPGIVVQYPDKLPRVGKRLLDGLAEFKAPSLGDTLKVLA